MHQFLQPSESPSHSPDGKVERGKGLAVDVLERAGKRRPATTHRLAMVAARMKDQYAAEAKERQKLSEGRGKKGPVKVPDRNAGDARDKAGDAVGVSGKSGGADFGNHQF